MTGNSFSSLGLEPRLVQVCKKRGYKKPTDVQREAIPALLKGRDVVAVARTGTGKTLAYLLPAINSLASRSQPCKGWECLVLVPTRELCLQVCEEADSIIGKSKMDLKATSLNLKGDEHLDLIVASAGSIVVGTPGQMSKLIEYRSLTAAHLYERLSMLIIDESDLLLSYGYGKDLNALASKIPQSCQCALVSATKSKDIASLEALLLKHPVSVDLVGTEKAQVASLAEDLVEHRLLSCFDEDRLLCLLVLLKMNLVKKRALVFVNSVHWAYKTKLFLQAFGLKSVLLHSEMPLNSRHHILKQFRKTECCQYMIVADDTHAALRPLNTVARKRKRGQPLPQHANKEEEFGVTRGIDFEGVATVVNLQLPDSPEGYIHRVGRTGRAGNNGTAITMVTPQDSEFQAMVEDALRRRQPSSETTRTVMAPFQISISSHMEALRSRAEEIGRKVTKKAIKTAQCEDVKNELINSEKLQSHFAAHPDDLTVLQHHNTLATRQNEYQLPKKLPSYIHMPAVIEEVARKKKKNRYSSRRMKVDPLKSNPKNRHK